MPGRPLFSYNLQCEEQEKYDIQEERKRKKEVNRGTRSFFQHGWEGLDIKAEGIYRVVTGHAYIYIYPTLFVGSEIFCGLQRTGVKNLICKEGKGHVYVKTCFEKFTNVISVSNTDTCGWRQNLHLALQSLRVSESVTWIPWGHFFYNLSRSLYQIFPIYFQSSYMDVSRYHGEYYDRFWFSILTS